MEIGLIEILEVAAIGLVAGIAGGLAGIGGSLIMLPGLALILGYADDAQTRQHLYMAAAMVVNVLVSLPAARRHHHALSVRFDVARIVLPAMAVTIVLGVVLSNTFEGRRLNLLLAAFIATYCVVNLSRFVRKTPEPEPHHDRSSPPRSVLVGAVTGLVAGLLGIGGGVLMVPMLQIFARLPLRQAIGTSSAVMVVTAAVGATIKFATLHTHGLDMGDAAILVLALGPAAFVGGRIGAMLTHRLPLQTVRVAISALLLIAAARLAFKALEPPRHGPDAPAQTPAE